MIKDSQILIIINKEDNNYKYTKLAQQHLTVAYKKLKNHYAQVKQNWAIRIDAQTSKAFF